MPSVCNMPGKSKYSVLSRKRALKKKKIVSLYTPSLLEQTTHYIEEEWEKNRAKK